MSDKLMSEYGVVATDTPEPPVTTQSGRDSVRAARELSESEAIGKVKGIAHDPAAGSWISARRATITDSNLAYLPDSALVSQGVRHRPADRAAWIVTFHNIRRTRQIYGYAPRILVGDEVAIVDALTGDIISEFGDARPVK